VVCSLWREDPEVGVPPEKRAQADRAITSAIDAELLFVHRSSASDPRYVPDVFGAEPQDYEFQCFDRDEVVRWAATAGFSQFPFTVADLPSAAPSASAPPQLQRLMNGLHAAWTEWESTPGDQSQKRLASLISQHTGVNARGADTIAAILRPQEAAKRDRRSRR